MTRTNSWILAVSLALLFATAASAEVETQYTRDQIGPGETLDLVLRVRGADEGAEPDWSAFGSDFDIVDVSRSQRTSIVNGRSDSSVEWRVSLAPRREGKLEVPAVSIGSSHSEPFSVTVSDAPSPVIGGNASGASSSGPVALDLEADDTNPYVQGRVLLTARIEASPDLIDGSLTDPQVDGAVVQRVGEDKRYRKNVGGEPRLVIERRYEVFPQRSGTLTIPPLVFEGRVRDDTPPPRGARRGPFAGFGGRSLIEDFFGGDPFGADPFAKGFFSGGVFDDLLGPPARSVRVASAGVTLDVQPRPEGASDQWFIPAHDVELVEQWEGHPPVFRVGEPVTRTLAIRATGVSGAQLPDLTLPPVDGAKQYSEPPVDDTQTVRDEVVSIKSWKTALIPTQAGELTLPEIAVGWWDTQADEARTARLPAEVVQVLPERGGVAAASGPPAAPDGSDAPATGPAAAAPSASGQVATVSERDMTWAEAGAGGVVLGLVLAVGFVALRRRRDFAAAPGAAATSAAAAAEPSRPAAAERRLRRACEASDAAGASAALRELARARWPEDPPKGAAAWGARLGSEELRGAVAELDRVRYSREPAEWRGEALWQAYRTAQRTTAKKGDRDADAGASGASGVLPSLYPSR